MTPDEIRAYATTLILDHARDVEYLTIHEMAEEHLDGGEISGDDAKAVSELISSATITVEWPAAPVAPATEDPAPRELRVWQSPAEIPRYLETPLRSADGTIYSRQFVTNELWHQALPNGTGGGHFSLVDLPADAWPLSEVPTPGGTE